MGITRAARAMETRWAYVTDPKPTPQPNPPLPCPPPPHYHPPTTSPCHPTIREEAPTLLVLNYFCIKFYEACFANNFGVGSLQICMRLGDGLHGIHD